MSEADVLLPSLVVFEIWGTAIALVMLEILVQEDFSDCFLQD
jgi:hypothetical protein